MSRLVGVQRNIRDHHEGGVILKGRLRQQRGGDAHVRMIAVVLMVGERRLRHRAEGVVTREGDLCHVVVMCSVMMRQAVPHLGPQQRQAQQEREQCA